MTLSGKFPLSSGKSRECQVRERIQFFEARQRVLDKYEYLSKNQLRRSEKKVLEANNEFLARHTQNAIELYASGDRDLPQTLAELEDNHQLGMSGSTIREILSDLINDSSAAKSEKRRERLLVLKSRLVME